MGPHSRIDFELKSISSRPKKWLGQNFLWDRNICERIVNSISLKKGSEIVEIGPGLGYLTEELLSRDYKVKAIEIDSDLASYLKIKFSDDLGSSLEIINEDAMKMIERGMIGPGDHIVSNLPYNISSRFMGALLDSTHLTDDASHIGGALIMFQKEFTHRLIAHCGGKEYGMISVMFRSKMDYELLFNVPKDRFHPVPKVDGTVISFKPRNNVELKPLDDRIFRSMVGLLFSNRRKKIKNSLRGVSIGLKIDDDSIEAILDRMDFTQMRPEMLEPDDMIRLVNELIVSSR